MAIEVITGRQLFVGAWDLSPTGRAGVVERTTAELDASRYGTGEVQVHEPGLRSVKLSGEALWDGGDNKLDDVLWSRIRESNVMVLLCETDGSLGEPATFVRGAMGSLTVGGAHGDLAAVSYSFGSSADPPDVRMRVLHPLAEISASATTTAVQLGAIAAGKRLWGALHVVGGSGGLDVKIQSDAAKGFGSPTDRIDFADVATGTARSSELKNVSGAVTDTWWRVSAALTGSGVARKFIVAAGII